MSLNSLDVTYPATDSSAALQQSLQGLRHTSASTEIDWQVTSERSTAIAISQNARMCDSSLEEFTELVLLSRALIAPPAVVHPHCHQYQV